jgi:Flp pilus assembly protein TadD
VRIKAGFLSMKPEYKANIYLAVFLIILGFAVYTNSLHNSFSDADDIPTIVENPHIQDFSRSWLNPHSLLNSIAYRISGYHPLSYHLISVIIHCINVILVFAFLSLYFKTQASFLASALFAVHPIHTEAVAWVSGRPYALMALFILVAYLLYYRATEPKPHLSLRGTERSEGAEAIHKVVIASSPSAPRNDGNASAPRNDGDCFVALCAPRNDIKTILFQHSQFRPLPYLLSLLLFSYFLVSNYSFFCLFPLFLILTDVVFKKWRRNWIWWLPYFAIVIIRLILAQNEILQRVTFMRVQEGFPPTKNPIVYFICSFYPHLGLLFWPQKLTLYHDPAITSWTMFYFSALYLIPIALCLFFTYKKAREVFWGLSIFILFLAPTYSPIQIATPIAERYVYFPSVSLSIFLAFLYEKFVAGLEGFKICFIVALILIITAFALRTVARNKDWKSSEIFWQKTVAVSPKSVKALNAMGLTYFRKGDMRSAIQEYNTAIQINPYYIESYNNRGVAYVQEGKFEQAISDYNKALEIKPNDAVAYNNRGVAYGQKGNLKQAISDCNQALQLKPDYADAYNNLAVAYFLKNNYSLSWEYLQKARSLGYKVNPKFVEDIKKASGR